MIPRMPDDLNRRGQAVLIVMCAIPIFLIVVPVLQWFGVLPR